MIHENHLGIGCYAFDKMIDEIFFGRDRQRYLLSYQGRTVLSAIKVECAVASTIFPFGGKDFVAGFEIKAPGDQVDGMGGIDQINKVIRWSIQIFSKCLARSLQVFHTGLDDELNRFLFHFQLILLVPIKHGPRACSEGSEVEESDVFTNQEFRAQLIGYHYGSLVGFDEYAGQLPDESKLRQSERGFTSLSLSAFA